MLMFGASQENLGRHNANCVVFSGGDEKHPGGADLDRSVVGWEEFRLGEWPTEELDCHTFRDQMRDLLRIVL